MIPDLQQLTIFDIHQLIRRKQLSFSELVQASLDRIEATDSQINSFINLNPNALEQANSLDNQFIQNPDLIDNKPLLGIPLGVKDLYVTQNLTTTAGSKIIDNYLPQYSATTVTRYLDAGAIIIGKLNQDAWGHGSSGENSDHFPTKNPWNIQYVPGGSSSGSGASVSAGQVLAATGTDTGSSVRLPAAFCNLVGLKPTYGRVSRYGVIAMTSSLDTIGHLTKTVAENALILSITAGHDPLDASTSSKPVPDYLKQINKPLSKYTIGIPKEYFIDGIDPQVHQATQQAINTFKKMGIKTKSVSLPHTDVAMACYYIFVPSEVSSNLARFDGIRYGHHRSTFGEEAMRRIMIGTHTLSSGYYDAYYRQAAKIRTLIKQDFDKVLEQVDFIIAPSSPTPPFKLEAKTTDPLQMYLSDIFLCPTNLAGNPSLNMPIGFTKEKLPVGMQIIGPHFSEDKIYHLAHHFEQETQYYKQTPKL